MDHDLFIRNVAELAGVSTDHAEALTRATLFTLGERITGGEVRDLAQRLPMELAPPRIPPEERAEKFGVEEFVRRVAERAHVDEKEARVGTRAVLFTLRRAAGNEFRDVVAQLPHEFTDFVGAAIL